MNNSYQLIDIKENLKLESIGGVILLRPIGLKFQNPSLPDALKYDYYYDSKNKKWQNSSGIEVDSNTILLSPTLLDNGYKYKTYLNDSGNVGFFPEHQNTAKVALEYITKGSEILNLFSYSGTSTIPLLNNDIALTNVDSSNKSHALFNENLKLNNLNQSVRVIKEDVSKYIDKEVQRGKKYHLILSDPPTSGRGSKGELFILKNLWQKHLMQLNRLLKSGGKIIFTHHTPDLTNESIIGFVEEELKQPILHFSNDLKSKTGMTLNSGQLFVIG